MIDLADKEVTSSQLLFRTISKTPKLFISLCLTPVYYLPISCTELVQLVHIMQKNIQKTNFVKLEYL